MIDKERTTIIDLVYRIKFLTDRIMNTEKGSELSKNYKLIRKFW